MFYRKKGRSTLTRHLERSEESMNGFFAFTQNDVVYQRGRSMVEMLGVLAIVGLISVMGVATFNTAMNKYRANKLVATIGEAFISAKTYRGNKTSVSMEDLNDIEIPSYIKSLEICKFVDIAKITFDDGANVDKIKTLLANTYGECRWTQVGTTYYITPNVGKHGEACDTKPTWDKCKYPDW